MSRIPAQRLHALRNNIPVDTLIQYSLNLPAKYREGFFRFLCPVCGEFNTATNPKTNLARCFTCSKNFNTIELVMLVMRCSFLPAVEFLEKTYTQRTPKIIAPPHRR